MGFSCIKTLTMTSDNAIDQFSLKMFKYIIYIIYTKNTTLVHTEKLSLLGKEKYLSFIKQVLFEVIIYILILNYL